MLPPAEQRVQSYEEQREVERGFAFEPAAHNYRGVEVGAVQRDIFAADERTHTVPEHEVRLALRLLFNCKLKRVDIGDYRIGIPFLVEISEAGFVLYGLPVPEMVVRADEITFRI